MILYFIYQTISVLCLPKFPNIHLQRNCSSMFVKFYLALLNKNKCVQRLNMF